MINDFFIRLEQRTIGHMKAALTFRKVGKASWILAPKRIIGGKRVVMGHHSFILYGSRIETYSNGMDDSVKIFIGDCVNIEQNVHITAMSRIQIGNKCSILGGGNNYRYYSSI